MNSKPLGLDFFIYNFIKLIINFYEVELKLN